MTVLLRSSTPSPHQSIPKESKARARYVFDRRGHPIDQTLLLLAESQSPHPLRAVRDNCGRPNRVQAEDECQVHRQHDTLRHRSGHLRHQGARIDGQ